jgi:uncharacterized protein YwgA
VNKDHILLKLALDRIGFSDIQLDGFTDRKILQKKIYLLQLTGIDLGFRYNWYVKGPYSPALADAAFALREEIQYDNEYEGYQLNPKTENKFEKLDEIIKLPDTFEAEEHEWLELLASLHYLKHIAYWSGKDNPPFEEIFYKLIKSKPQFTNKKELVEAAWQRLNENGLVESKTLE